MIESFSHKGLEKSFEKDDNSGLPAQQVAKIRSIMAQLEAASKPEEMNFPGSDYHPLKGKRKGVYSAKVTGNYRITFRFNKKDGNAFDVNYEDYH
ncbi:type II toxin-antitoxin system RelE/ParE family toxin [Spirosoma linguale]|uniref:Plasmid maintenance system killer n=1 Tax=Spirosoma linguale (strain ATCC 33905 / DSM 74 / LMG 10896 / Claus 1) TaxID=504472 RepID=D2QVW0_SPILD|nr:plasmid maintenance system killer [Spirosoma linguale DSM 74]